MHVLYACADPGIPFWGTKGASIHVRSFTRALAEAGHDVSVVMSRIGNHTRPLPARIRLLEVPNEQEGFFETGSNTTPDALVLLSEARQFLQNRSMQDIINDSLAHRTVDIICERYSLFGIAGRESARWHNVPFVLEVNAPLVIEQKEHRRLLSEPLAREIEHYLFSTADCVVPVSETLAGYIRSVAPDAKIRTIANGVDIEAFANAVNVDHWRQRWELPDRRDQLIGFVGSLKPWHGLDLLLEAFAGVLASGNRAKLVLIGDGPLRGTIERDVVSRGLTEHVLFTGSLAHSDVPSATQALDILVAPYPDMEHFYFSPLKVYEYMAAGKPIVASQIGQISQILAANETALLVPPGDVPALTSAITTLLGDKALSARLGSRAQHVARDRHGWDRRVAQWTEMFGALYAKAATEEVRV